MIVFVLNKHKQPLMPCSPAKARKLLKEGKAKVIRREPFTIKLLYGSRGYKQETQAGMDTGSKKIGCAVVGNGRVYYQSEITIRDDVSSKMESRKSYRRTRRNRNTRYRQPRWSNRASMRKEGRIAPSIQSKVDSHLREKNFVEKILPISEWIVEVADFDIHKITNPDVTGKDYQEGQQKDFYNTKAFVLARDNYRCQNSKAGIKHSKALHVHHIVFRSQGGTNSPSNLITLCASCHKALHRGDFLITKPRSKTRHPTQIGIVKGALISSWSFTPTFGYETKFKREQLLGLSKTHYHDAVAICYTGNNPIQLSNTVYFKRHVASGDYQQRKGKHSEKIIPTGKLFGLRKFDYIDTIKGKGFVKGKRSSGYFSIMDIHGNAISNSVNIKNSSCQRLSARTTTLIQRESI